MKNNKVVYAWYHNNEVFYIGIGENGRQYRTTSRNPLCLNKRAKAERENTFKVTVLFECLSWDQACKIECELIQEFGRRDNGTGCLTNMTDGGEGTQGNRLSSESKRKISESHKGKKHTKRTKHKMSMAKKNKKLSGNHAERIREGKRKSTYVHATGKDNPCSRPVTTPLGDFANVRLAAEAHKITRGSMSQKVNGNNIEYYRA